MTTDRRRTQHYSISATVSTVGQWFNRTCINLLYCWRRFRRLRVRRSQAFVWPESRHQTHLRSYWLGRTLQVLRGERGSWLLCNVSEGSTGWQAR